MSRMCGTSCAPNARAHRPGSPCLLALPLPPSKFIWPAPDQYAAARADSDSAARLLPVETREGGRSGSGAAAAGQASALAGSPRVPLLAGEAEEEAAQALWRGIRRAVAVVAMTAVMVTRTR